MRDHTFRDYEVGLYPLPKIKQETIAVKELPILFNGEMVRAILEGRKTVTRRPVKGWQIPTEDLTQEGRQRWSAIAQRHPRYGFCVFGETASECAQELATSGSCPFGKPGDLLWVRETTEADELTSDSVTLSRYAADRAPVLHSGLVGSDYNGTVAHWDYPRGSRPSIHMHRWASRILLKINNIRAERLDQMSVIDYQAEGCHGGHGSIPGYVGNATPCEHFHHVWDSTGGNSGGNPWVWVIEFSRIEAGFVRAVKGNPA